MQFFKKFAPHPSDQQLIALHFNNADARLQKHISNCNECASRLSALNTDLAFITPPPATTWTDADRERIWRGVQQRIATASITQSPSSSSRHSLSPWRFALAGALGLLLISAAFSAGRFWEKSHHVQTPIAHTIDHPAPQTSHQAAQPLVVIVLNDHLERSEQLLVELKHADSEDEDLIAPMRDQARRLLTANRTILHDQSAHPDAHIKRTLTKLDHLLAGIAAQSNNISPEEMDELQQELLDGKLLFEIRILRATPDAEMKITAQPTKGGNL